MASSSHQHQNRHTESQYGQTSTSHMAANNVDALSPSAFAPRVDASRLRQPHSMANRKISLEALWTQVEPGLTSVFQLKKMDKKGYMELYSLVYSYCMSIASPSDFETDSTSTVNTPSRLSSKKRTKEATSPPSNQAAWVVCMELYKKLRDYIGSHLVSVLSTMIECRGEDLLASYAKQWKNFCFSSRVTHGMCMYLNRHWVKRENDEGLNREIYEVYAMCLVQWRDRIFDPLEGQLSRAVLDLIGRERNGEIVNSQLLRTVIDSLVELGISHDMDEEHSSKPHSPRAEKDHQKQHVCLQVYKTAFEVPFLDETVTHYVQESQNFLAGNSVNEYVKKVLAWLTEEEVRCTKYLHDSTAAQLRKTAEEVLIVRQLKILHDELFNLLAQEKLDELSSMYTLLLRVPSRVKDLYQLVEDHIKSYGGAAVARDADKFVQDPQTFVMAILDVYDRSSRIISGAFNGDQSFTVAMDKAFTHLINNNAITRCTSPSKVSELLAKYCDTVLKKSTKNPNEVELEESLTRVMIIFRYVEEKDVFQKFYSKMLAKRLVHGMSASDDAEATMISKLKAACGFEYTSKLQRMFQDIGLSHDLNNQFREQTEEKNIVFDFDFTVQVLSTGAWPIAERNSLVLPVVLERPVATFREFYQSKYHGRKLTWLFNLSRCELSADFFKDKKKRTLQALTYQVAVLMCFNEVDFCPVSKLKTIVECEHSFFNQVLLSLLKTKILVMQNEAEEVDEKDLEGVGASVKLNLAFRSSKMRINLGVQMRSEQKQEEDATNRDIEEDRKMLIQATIVRIMKMRKQLNHQQLIGEVMQLLASRFKPGVAIIKKCIEILIQKEYMKRDDDSKELYIYIA